VRTLLLRKGKPFGHALFHDWTRR